MPACVCVQVIKEVPVEVVRTVIKEVPKETIKEVPVEVIKVPSPPRRQDTRATDARTHAPDARTTQGRRSLAVPGGGVGRGPARAMAANERWLVGGNHQPLACPPMASARVVVSVGAQKSCGARRRGGGG